MKHSSNYTFVYYKTSNTRNYYMTLITSISGIRGTIGGKPNNNLTPIDAVKYTAAFAQLLRNENPNQKLRIVLGRDGRMSGEALINLVAQTLVFCGIDVLNLDLSTTPSVEMAVPFFKAHGGIILTASHNPKEWNALKLLNAKGEFISAKQGEEMLSIAANNDIHFASVDELGSVKNIEGGFVNEHIAAILQLPYINTNAIASKNFKVVVDGINSTGATAVPALLEVLGIKNIEVIHAEISGNFAHNPEPLAAHLVDISEKVKSTQADLGIVVDPDVDRLAFVCEDGSMFGEEYTLVAAADFILSKKAGNTVSNMSSTRALRDITEKAGFEYAASAVGEVNVVEKMKAINAVIGGEGNGGVILPDLHYGRDALAGIALVLNLLAEKNIKMTELRNSYPYYVISKNKIELEVGMDVDGLLEKMKMKYEEQPHSTIDGLKIEFGNEWVHLRKSNTEPIIRIYSESTSIESADKLALRFVAELKEMAL